MDPHDPRVAAWRALRRAHALLSEALEEALAAHALPLHGYDVLDALSASPGGRLRMLDLCGQVPLTKSGLTRLVDRLEGDDLVRRESCPSDRRGTYAAITPAGRRVLRRAAQDHVAVIEQRFVARLTRHELVCLGTACAKLTDPDDAGG